ncbi:MAG: asparagine synthase (glutamine-hydrolyzing) [Rhabdochlamydiaceae bacterium]
MCGILACLNKKWGVSSDSLYESLFYLKHRGPDQKNVWISPNGDIALAHSRLAITGSSNGLQPISWTKEGIHIVVNGEFYDYKEIRSRYESLGYSFQTDSDSEILIPLYLEYGLQLFSHLNGEFAFILWDEKKERMICARDRFGIKPLFYAQKKGAFYAASEIKGLIPFLGEFHLSDYDLFSTFQGVLHQGRTCFRDIYQVHPGHCLIWDKEKIVESKYWDFEYKEMASFDQKEYVSLFKEKLSLAIRRRLDTSAPKALYLSGGIDSSALLALSSEMGFNLTAFNMSFEDPVFDEAPYAVKMARHRGLDVHSLMISEQDVADHFEEAIFHKEGLVHQTNGIAKFLLNKYVSSLGYKVVLTGEGADEILGGYPCTQEDVFEQQAFSKDLFLSLQREYKAVSSAFVTSKSLLRYKSLRSFSQELGYLPSVWKMGNDIQRRLKNLYDPLFRQKLSGYEPLKDFCERWDLKNKKHLSRVNQSLYISCKSYLSEFVLNYLGDRMEMAHSLEGRLPFLDVDLVEFCNTLPSFLKIHGEKEKFILYEAVKDLIPLCIYERKKQMFSVPHAFHKNKSPIKEHIADIIYSQDFASLPFFSAQKVRELFEKASFLPSRERMIAEFAFNLILSTYYLDRLFVKKAYLSRSLTVCA